MEQVNVAIADDNERILDLLEEIINMDKELHVVGKAKNGEEMCQIIRNKQPDVVLLDLIMPKMDGLTVMEKINQDKNVQKRPDFIVVTAVGQERITEDAFNRGANYYIMKPFNLNYSWISIRPNNCTMSSKIDSGSSNYSEIICQKGIKSLWQFLEELFSCQGSLIVAIPAVHTVC